MKLINILDNAGSIASKIEAELTYLREKGATPEQLKSLESKLDLANKVQQYEPIIRIAGKPLIKRSFLFLIGCRNGISYYF